jgi:hypothetical protein
MQRLGWFQQWLLVLGLMWIGLACHGQGNFQPIRITFDGPPLQPPGTSRVTDNYSESGVWFRSFTNALGYTDGFIRSGVPTEADPRWPDNGTAYLQADNLSTLAFSFTNGWLFSLQAVDLAEYSLVVPDAVTVRFVGYRYDGSKLVTHLTTDGIMDGMGPLADFETFQFGPEWYGLTRVEIPIPGWSLDNLVVVRWIPEPGTGALLLVGGLVLCAKRYLKAH